MTPSETSGTAPENSPIPTAVPVTVNVGKNGNGNGKRYPPTAQSNAVVAWLEFIIKLLIIPALIWGVNIERRITRIESSRFTTEDGLSVWRELDRKIDRTDVPPIWFQDEVDDLKERQNRFETMLQDHIAATNRMLNNQ